MVTCFKVRCRSLLKERKKLGNLLFDESQNILDLRLKNSFAMTSLTLQKSSNISVQFHNKNKEVLKDIKNSNMQCNLESKTETFCVVFLYLTYLTYCYYILMKK